MSGVFLLFKTNTGGVALLRPSQIGGILASNPDLRTIAKERALRLLVGGGETVDVVATSPEGIVRSMGAAEDDFKGLTSAGRRYAVYEVES